MKTLLFCFLALIILAPNVLSQYVDEPETIPILQPYQVYYPGPNTYPVADLTEIDDDSLLDLAMAQNLPTYLPSLQYWRSAVWGSNTGGIPTFGSGGQIFFETVSTDIEYTTDVAFGLLRPGEKRDLAIGRSHQTQIHLNADNTIATEPLQTLEGAAMSICWGPFDQTDDRHDLAVASGSDVKIYKNDGEGYLETTPYTFSSLPATKIILAQMNQRLYQPANSDDRWDLVSISGNVISIHYNSNNNQFDTVQAVEVEGWSEDEIRDIAVGDLNNDGFNDAVVTSLATADPSVVVFLNDGSGRLDTSPTFAFSSCCYNGAVVAIADMGSPSGDATRNDGWNDIVLADVEALGGVLINSGSNPFFSQTLDQDWGFFGPPWSTPKQIRTADVQNLGGQSVLIAMKGGGYYPNEWNIGGLYLLKHNGDPAPAPPKNVQVSGVSAQRGYVYPRITWEPNTERDLNGYELWRRVTGICGNGNWYLLSSTIDASVWEYIDETIATVSYTGDCTAEYKLRARDEADNLSSYSSTVSIAFSSLWFKTPAGRDENIPASYTLHEAYPNPFNPTTVINYDLPVDSRVTLKVYDVLGKEVATLVDGYVAAGYHHETFNAAQLSSGVYFYRITAGNFTQTRKLLLLR